MGCSQNAGVWVRGYRGRVWVTVRDGVVGCVGSKWTWYRHRSGSGLRLGCGCECGYSHSCRLQLRAYHHFNYSCSYALTSAVAIVAGG